MPAVTLLALPALLMPSTSGPVTALVLERDNAIKAWRELMGPTNTFKAKEEAPDRCVELWRGLWIS